MESRPAMLKTSEKARKYHFLPNQSMLGLRKNSTMYFRFLISDRDLQPVSRKQSQTTNCRSQIELNAQRFSRLFPVQQRVKDGERYEHGREQVCQPTKGNRGCKAAHRAGAENKQNERRNDGRNVGIDNRDPGMSKALVQGCSSSLAV